MKLLIAFLGLFGAIGAQDQSAIRAARIAQNRAIAAGDLDAVASFWTEDVAIRRGLGQPVTGSDAYRKLFDRTGAGDSTLVYQRRTTGVEVSAHWPLAFETGTWAGHVGSATGPAAIRGRYSAQWVKRDGRWLIRAEVFVALSCSGVGCRSAAAP
jgi:uncharacterized protein (TIGR02246 family)